MKLTLNFQIYCSLSVMFLFFGLVVADFPEYSNIWYTFGCLALGTLCFRVALLRPITVVEDRN